MLISENDLLQQLVRIPSVNPQFETPESASGKLEVLTDFLADFCTQRDWPWLRQQVHPGQENLVAVIEPKRAHSSDQVMLWDAHQDTVGTAGMTIDPFAAEERAGRIWGRGACDVKGGMAAILATAARLSEATEDLRSPTHFGTDGQRRMRLQRGSIVGPGVGCSR